MSGDGAADGDTEGAWEVLGPGSMQSISCEMLDLDESQAGIKIARSNSNNLRYADGTTLVAENRETKKLLDVGERGE